MLGSRRGGRLNCMLAARLAAMAAARGGEVLRADALLGRGLMYYSPSSLRTTWVANATSIVLSVSRLVRSS